MHNFIVLSWAIFENIEKSQFVDKSSGFRDIYRQSRLIRRFSRRSHCCAPMTNLYFTLLSYSGHLIFQIPSDSSYLAWAHMHITIKLLCIGSENLIFHKGSERSKGVRSLCTRLHKNEYLENYKKDIETLF